MRPTSFDYVAPRSPDECLDALAGGGTALAGGQSLLPLLKLRAQRPTLIVDLNKATELQGIGRTDGSLTIGAMTRHQRIADDPLVGSVAPMLADAARQIGDVQVRARGTIGGNVCFADPRANMSTALIALGATATIRHQARDREVAVTELFTGPRESSLHPGELLTRFDVALHAGAARSCYLEVAPQPNGVPIVNVAVTTVDNGLRIAVGGLLPVPCRATPVEEAVAREGASPAAINHAVDELTAGDAAFADPRGNRAYRARIAAVLIGRAVQRAQAVTAAREG